MPNIHTLTDHVKLVQAIAPQAVSTGADAVTGSGVDCAGYEGLLAIVNVGNVDTGSTKYVIVLLQESSDDGDTDSYADISLATTPSVLLAGDDEVYLIELNLSERERYIRCTIDGGDGDGSDGVSVSFALFRGRLAVPTQQNTVVQVGFAR